MNVFISSDTQPTRITLDRKLGSGGEGTVYAVAGDTTRCVKIYHEKKRTPELEAKLTAMIAAPPKDPTLAAGHYSICWPQAIVYEDEACTTFIGFIMPLIDTKVFREYHLLCDKPGATSSVCYRLENFGTGFTYLHMYVVALNLASCVASIHEAGHAIGDLNDKNILVSTKDSKITIVDCDSFEIHGTDGKIFPCSVYMPEYSAPEVIKHEPIENRQLSDRFALAVLIFKLLMLNTHPYASRGSSVEHLNTPGEKIADGYYPYEDYENLEVFPPAYALPYEIIPPNIKELFRRCFKEGQHNPEIRPSALQWVEAIRKEFLEMHSFQKNQHKFCEKNLLHIYPCHISYCLWCTLKDDYFPVKYMKLMKRSKVKEDTPFEYLTKLMDFYSDDQKISKDEYRKLYYKAQTLNVSDDELSTMVANYMDLNKSVIMGDIPSFSTNFIDFQKIYWDGDECGDAVVIKNNFISDILVLDVSASVSSYLKVTPSGKVTINPGSSKALSIMLNPKRIRGRSGMRSVQINIKSLNSNFNYEHKVQIKLKYTLRFDWEIADWLKLPRPGVKFYEKLIIGIIVLFFLLIAILSQ